MSNVWQCPSLPVPWACQASTAGQTWCKWRKYTEKKEMTEFLRKVQTCSKSPKKSCRGLSWAWWKIDGENSKLAPAFKKSTGENVIIVIIFCHLYISLLLTLHRNDYRHIEARRSMYRDWAYVVHILTTRWLCLTLVWRGICVCSAGIGSVSMRTHSIYNNMAETCKTQNHNLSLENIAWKTASLVHWDKRIWTRAWGIIASCPILEQ